MSQGVDYDQRSKKYRARLTRKGKVYHLGYFVKKEDAVAARKNAEESYEAGKKFDFLHSYNTSSQPVEAEGDPYLFYIQEQDTVYAEDPERSIRLAVLVQAIKDLLHPSDTLLREDATDWINGDCNSPPSYSFLEIIEFLGFPEDMVRDSLDRACQDRQAALRKIGRRLVRTQGGGDIK